MRRLCLALAGYRPPDHPDRVAERAVWAEIRAASLILPATPERRRAGEGYYRGTCPVCQRKFAATTSKQRTCSRTCGWVMRRRRAET